MARSLPSLPIVGGFLASFWRVRARGRAYAAPSAGAVPFSPAYKELSEMCHAHGPSLHLARHRLTPSDLHLITAVQRRNEAALTALYERYRALVFALALRRLSDRGLAEEVLQDVFLRCWVHAASYRPDAGSVSAWLFGITRNRTIDVRRRQVVAVHPGECDKVERIGGLRDCEGWSDAGEILALRFE